MTSNPWVAIAAVILGLALGFTANYLWARRRRRPTATYLRQAAALLLHAREEGEDAVEGIRAVLQPLPRGEEWIDLTGALVFVAAHAFEYAREGDVVEYLRAIATGAALKEMGDDD